MEYRFRDWAGHLRNSKEFSLKNAERADLCHGTLSYWNLTPSVFVSQKSFENGGINADSTTFKYFL